MANRLVHEIFTFIVFGLPYAHVHREKDAPSQHVPGVRHRKFRHGWYQTFGKHWTFTNPFPQAVSKKTVRLRDVEGPTQAEEYQVEIAHDYIDRLWDYEGLTREERTYQRKYVEGLYISILLNPALLKPWAGVDVLAGKIHRVIDGEEVWEEEPAVKREYRRLRAEAYRKLHRDTKLRRLIEQYGGPL